MTDEIPKGVSAIFVVDGRVIAHASDFNRSTPGGYTLQEAQELRARQSLARAVVRELSSRLLCDSLDVYDCERIIHKLPGKIHLLTHGYSGDSASPAQEKP